MFKWKAEIEGDRIQFLGEEYPLGHFCLELLQHARVHDAVARVSVLWDYLDQHLRELQNGLILQKQIKEIHDMIARVLPDLETLPPFHLTGVEELRQSVETLFTEEAAEQIADYAKQFHTRALDQAELWVQVHYDLSNNPIRHPGKQLLEQEKAFLSEFIQLCYDLGDVDSWLHRFVRRLNEIDEAGGSALAGKPDLPQSGALAAEPISRGGFGRFGAARGIYQSACVPADGFL